MWEKFRITLKSVLPPMGQLRQIPFHAGKTLLKLANCCMNPPPFAFSKMFSASPLVIRKSRRYTANLVFVCLRNHNVDNHFDIVIVSKM